MNKEDFHIPFIKSLLVVAIVTVFAVISSHYVVNYYGNKYHFQYSSSKIPPEPSTKQLK